MSGFKIKHEDVLVFRDTLKNNCGYPDMPNEQIRCDILIFAQKNLWDLSNYGAYDIRALGEDSYRDLSGHPLTVAEKCESLATNFFSLLG